MNTFKIDKSSVEHVGQNFNQEEMLLVRQKTIAVVQQIIANCKPGMLEEDAVEMARDLLAEYRMLRGWHEVYVRFGQNTTKTYGMESEPNVILGENDIMFVDIGPVFQKWEGDAGDTFVFGNDADMHQCASDARKLFHIVRKKWEIDRSTGQELYHFAEQEAEKMGWLLNMDWAGHRISDFPHAIAYEGLMADVDFCPSALLWILEIHIRHPQKPFGAFYEDMLLPDHYFD